MAVIVRHEDEQDQQYILLGTGFGMFKAMRGATLGDILSKSDEGDRSLAALCGVEGKIIWADTSRLTVVSVDSRSPQEILEAL